MKKFIAALVGALALSVVFSGCFFMRTLVYTDDAPKAGKKTTAKISVAGESGVSMSSRLSQPRGSENEYPFYLIGGEGGKVKNGGVFDKKGVFDGPVDLNVDSDLLDAGGDECLNSSPFRGPGGGFKTVVTDDPFVATNDRKFMLTKLPIKADDDTAVALVIIWQGTWADDGDGVPEDPDTTDDEYICQPPYTSVLKVKGGTPAP